MNIVIDTSAIIAVIDNEPEKKRLIKLTSGFDLIAPKSIYCEIGNAFSALFKRNQATLKQAKDAINIFNTDYHTEIVPLISKMSPISGNQFYDYPTMVFQHFYIY